MDFYFVELKPHEKAPAGGKGWQKRVSQTTEHFAPNANVGILCGARIYDGHTLLCVDVDTKRGKQGLKSLERLKADGYHFPRTATASTPTGGLHFYYAIPDAIDIEDCYSLFPNWGYPDIDCLGHGRYAVAAPSVTPDGAYRWDVSPDEFTDSVPVAPWWLLEQVRLRSLEAVQVTRKAPEKADEKPKWTASANVEDFLVLEDIKKRFPIKRGRRFFQQTRMACSLICRGLTEEKAIALILEHAQVFPDEFNSPWPLVVEEVTEAVESASQKLREGKLTAASSDLHLQKLISLPAPPLTHALLPSLTSKEGQRELTETERAFVELLLVLLDYHQSLNKPLAFTNGQIIQLMQERYGIELSEAKDVRRLKDKFISKVKGEKEYKATKAELFRLVSVGHRNRGVGVPSTYDLGEELKTLLAARLAA